ncbi:hypothetical protein F8M41_000529 [Gigaspora margarita]|uniref:Uncharacterized protein n=1 Tax=Gigaspora margarita TaxID=4874 RepID=A0A8H3XGQ3_GIGMA|nr:hypothetical protein F8M41_000529 [Gigaspora margarita]
MSEGEESKKESDEESDEESNEESNEESDEESGNESEENSEEESQEELGEELKNELQQESEEESQEESQEDLDELQEELENQSEESQELQNELQKKPKLPLTSFRVSYKTKTSNVAKKQMLFEGLLLELTTITTTFNETITSIQNINQDNKSLKSVGEMLAKLYQDAWIQEIEEKKIIQKTIRSWYDYAEQFENYVSKLVDTGIKNKTARSQIYDEIEPFILSNSMRNNLRVKTHKARKIYKLFKGVGVDKIERVKRYSADQISYINMDRIQLLISCVNKYM